MVVAQSGFHDAAIDVFACLRSHCDSPPIWICRSSFGRQGGGGPQPLSISLVVGEDTSLLASLFRRKIVLKQASSLSWVPADSATWWSSSPSPSAARSH